MSRSTTSRRGRQLAALAAGAVLLLGACGSSDSSSDDSSSTTSTAAESSTTTAGSGGESAETKRFDEEVQQWLIDVGCYDGSVDGIAGPETDAAIVAFQEAEGLTADGEVGTETEAALKSAAEAGTKVCGASGSTTTTAASGGSTTTTKATPAGATCTATSLSAAVGETINSYVCSGGYAGVEYGTEADEQAVLKVEGSAWVDVTDEVCGAASAGISPQVLELGCSAATGSGSDASTTTTAA